MDVNRHPEPDAYSPVPRRITHETIDPKQSALGWFDQNFLQLPVELKGSNCYLQEYKPHLVPFSITVGTYSHELGI